MNSSELRRILGLTVPTTYQTGVLACDQLNLVKKKKFAIIINTDDSTKPGLHWLSIFKESDNCEIVEFFDSFSLPVSFYNDKIGSFLSKFSRVRTSTAQMQSTFSDVCGQFSVYFLVSRIHGIPYSVIVNSFSRSDLLKNDEKVKTFVEHNFMRHSVSVDSVVHDDVIDLETFQCCKKQIKSLCLK